MHNLGRFVLLPLFLLLSLLGFYLSMRLLAVQNSWTVAFDKAKEANVKAVDDVSRDARVLSDVSLELSEASLGRGRFWPTQQNVTGIPTTVSGQTVQTSIGANNGVKKRTVKDEDGNDITVDPLLYAFVDNPDGTSKYIGLFRAVQMQPQQATLRPTWTLRPGEAANRWKGDKWRFREHIPLNFKTSLLDLRSRLAKGSQTRQSLEQNIALQDELAKRATEQLDFRVGELLGNPDYPEITDRPELTVGLVKAIEEREEERNTLQINVDRLRRQIRDEIARTSRLRTEIPKLVNSLPQPAAATLSSRRGL